MNSPLISIVTPSFNQGRFIRQTVESILSQDYRGFEHWVIDGGSTDETVSVLEQFSDPRFHWISAPDKGQSDAINKGLARCQGEIFNWINSDDYLESGALAKIARAFERGDKIFSGNLRKLDDATGQTNGYYALELKSRAEDTLALGRFCQPSTFWRMDLFRACAPVREELHCAMDFHLWAQHLVREGLAGISRTQETLAHYREHQGSKSARLNAQFKDEIAAIYADLLTALEAPAFLVEHFARATTKHLSPTKWQPGKQFQRRRLFAILSHQVGRKFYYDRAYTRSREWIKNSLRFEPTLPAWRFYFKLLWKK